MSLPSPPHALGSARWTALAGALLGALLPAAAVGAPAEAGTILVKLDRDASRAERAAIVDALGAESSRGLPAGWRAYRVPDEMTAAEARHRLSGTSADRAVEPDATMRAALTPNDPDFPLLYGLPLIQAPAAWDVPPLGAPVVVAVIDGGVDLSHPDLASMVWTNPAEIANGVDDDGNGLVDDLRGWDFFHQNATVYDDPAEDRHATHVAGTIGAERNNGLGVAGVAGNVRIMSLKFLGTMGAETGVGSTSDAIAAIAYARQKGARIINASWGGPSSQALCDAVAAAVSDGILVVTAAGNESVNNDVVASDPANCPSPGVVSVAATTSADQLASSFSNYGPATVDLGAPGQGIRSTTPAGAYDVMSGTSMAAPHVSGAAALVLGRVPGLTPAALRSVLMAGGTVLPSLANLTVSGRRLDVMGAIDLAVNPASDTTPPLAFLQAAPAESAFVGARPDFAWTEAVDLGSGVARYRVVVDGSVVAEVAAETLRARPAADLADGSHTWTVEAEDRAGNRRSTITRAFLVDSGPPLPFALDSPSPGAAVNTRRPRFRWTGAADPGAGVAGYRLVVDGIASVTYAPETRAAQPDLPLPDGEHTWEVRAVDRLGRERSSERRTVVVDATAPAIFGLRTPVDGARIRSRRPGLVWTPAKDGRGPVRYTVVLDGRIRVAGLRTASWRPRAALRTGRHTWSVIAADAAGNTRRSFREEFAIAGPRPRKRR